MWRVLSAAQRLASPTGRTFPPPPVPRTRRRLERSILRAARRARAQRSWREACRGAGHLRSVSASCSRYAVALPTRRSLLLRTRPRRAARQRRAGETSTRRRSGRPGAPAPRASDRIRDRANRGGPPRGRAVHRAAVSRQQGRTTKTGASRRNAPVAASRALVASGRARQPPRCWRARAAAYASFRSTVRK